MSYFRYNAGPVLMAPSEIEENHHVGTDSGKPCSPPRLTGHDTRDLEPRRQSLAINEETFERSHGDFSLRSEFKSFLVEIASGSRFTVNSSRRETVPLGRGLKLTERSSSPITMWPSVTMHSRRFLARFDKRPHLVESVPPIRFARRGSPYSHQASPRRWRMVRALTRLLRPCFLLAAGLLVCVPGECPASAYYSVTTLDQPSGELQASALNNAGQVAGTWIQDHNPLTTSSPYLYNPSAGGQVTLVGVTSPSGQSSGGYSFQGNFSGINNNGQAVGWTNNVNPSSTVIYKITTGQITTAPVGSGIITDSGQVYGFIAGGGGTSHPAVYQNGSVQDLGLPPGSDQRAGLGSEQLRPGRGASLHAARGAIPEFRAQRREMDRSRHNYGHNDQQPRSHCRLYTAEHTGSGYRRLDLAGRGPYDPGHSRR